MRVLHFATAFVVALIVTWAIMPAVMRLAHRLGAVDQPGGRRVHSGQVPRLGGLGIFLGFVAGLGAALLTAGRAHSIGDPSEWRWYGAAIGGCMIFASGILDDLFHFRARTKLLLQLAAALVAVSLGVTIEATSVPGVGVVNLGALGPLAALAWILVITNAINLIDGLDGLAGGVALIVTTTMASVALAVDRFAVVVAALALAGSLLGFLRYNFAPAKIFMGDAGSQFLGFTLAIISIRGSQKGAAAVAIAVPLLALGLPLADLILAILRRARHTAGEPSQLFRRIARADRRHVHHTLIDSGLNTRRAVLTLYLIASLFALSGYLSMVSKSPLLAVLTLCLSVGSVILIQTAFSNGREDKERAAQVGPADPSKTLSN